MSAETDQRWRSIEETMRMTAALVDVNRDSLEQLRRLRDEVRGELAEMRALLADRVAASR